MRVDYQKTKSLLYKIIFSFDLFIIFIIILTTEIKSNNLKEYTGVSHLILNIYIIIIFIFLVGHSFFPIYKPKILVINFNFILTNIGKIITIFLISMIYRFSESIPHYILGIILFISSFILFIYEFIFNFSFIIELLKLKGIELYNKENKEKNNQKFSIENIETTADINPNHNNSSNSSRLDIVKQK